MYTLLPGEEWTDDRRRAGEAMLLHVVLYEGIAEYRYRRNQMPSCLEDLITAGVLSQLPINPYTDRPIEKAVPGLPPDPGTYVYAPVVAHPEDPQEYELIIYGPLGFHRPDHPHWGGVRRPFEEYELTYFTQGILSPDPTGRNRRCNYNSNSQP
jgi:hypothetical protein